jgi:hypothetical protein
MPKLELVDDKRRSTSPVSDEDDIEELRKKFVGDITLPESASFNRVSGVILTAAYR